MKRAIEKLRALSLAGRFRLALGAAMAVLAGVLATAPKPWQSNFPAKASPGYAGYLDFYGWWGVLGALVVLAALAATAGWWAVPAPAEARSLRPPRIPNWSRLLIAGAVIFLAWAAWPRMHHSLAHDERLSVRRAIVGDYRLGKDGTPKLRVVPWRQTLFYYIKPNNHVFHSVLSRLSWEAWRVFRRPGTRDFEEWVLRLPAFLAGLAAVALMGVQIGRLIGPGAGALTAWLLALHPWYLRYASEARGYSLVMALTALLLILWYRVQREQSWQWWLALAFVQFAMVHTYAGALAVLVVFNAGAAGVLIYRAGRDTSQWPNVHRWLAASSMAGAAAILFMLPLLPQYLPYLELPEAKGTLGINWLRNTGAALISGLSWNKTLTPGLGHFELQQIAQARPILFWACVGGGGLLALAGFAEFWRRGGGARLAAAVLLLPVVLKVGMSHLSGRYVFEWYTVILVPGLAAMVAAGVFSLSRLGRWRALLAVAVAGAYGFLNWPAIQWMRRHPIEGSRDTVLVARGTLNPYAPGQEGILTASIQLIPDLYDPRCLLLRTPEDMIALLRKADASGKPLYIYAGNLWSAAFQTPQLWRLLAESGMFDDFVFFRSFEPGGDHVVARYVPGAIEKFDQEAFPNAPDVVPNADAPPLTYSQTGGKTAAPHDY